MCIMSKCLDHNYKCASYSVWFQVHVISKWPDHYDKCASYDILAQHIQQISKWMPKPTAPPQSSNLNRRESAMHIGKKQSILLPHLINSHHIWSRVTIFEKDTIFGFSIMLSYSKTIHRIEKRHSVIMPYTRENAREKERVGGRERERKREREKERKRERERKKERERDRSRRRESQWLAERGRRQVLRP